MPPGNADLKVKVGSTDIPIQNVFEIQTQSDKDQPDMATVTLVNISGQRSESIAPGTELIISAGGDKPIFNGDIIGIEPFFDQDLPSRVTIRALNKLHRLARGRKTRSFTNSTDQRIVEEICKNAGGLSAQCDSEPTTEHDQVYQHNQTDLEFIRQRAARIDFEVWVDRSTLFFKKRLKLDTYTAQLKFRGTGDGEIIRFRPRLSTTGQVSKVTCHGWDAANKKAFIGVAEPEGDFLSKKTGTAMVGIDELNGKPIVLEVGRPVYSQAEANEIAKAILKDRLMNFITGEVLCHGLPEVKPGAFVEIDVPDSRFKGKYYVAGVSHRYIYPSAEASGLSQRETGYRTILRVQRDSAET